MHKIKVGDRIVLTEALSYLHSTAQCLYPGAVGTVVSTESYDGKLRYGVVMDGATWPPPTSLGWTMNAEAIALADAPEEPSTRDILRLWALLLVNCAALTIVVWGALRLVRGVL